MVAGLEVQMSVCDDVVVVATIGEVDIATAPQLDDVLVAAITAGADAGLLCCDLSQVTFLDSTGLSTLALARNRASAEGLEFCIVGASGPVEKVLKLTAMDRVFASYDSVNAARRERGDDPRPLPVG